MFAESQDTFFFTFMIAIMVQVAFVAKDDGLVNELICRMEGIPDRRATRIH